MKPTMGLSTAAWGIGLGCLVVLVGAPFVLNDYFVSVLILALYFALLAQAWNVMMGFAGLLSLGHILYAGLGAYVSAGLFVHFSVSPWLGMIAACALSCVVGGAIALLAFRYAVDGVYFGVLTIAFAEFFRVVFEHLAWTGAAKGLFVPVQNRATSDLLTLRGSSLMFYFVILGMTLAALAACAWLRNSTVGLRLFAIRENPEAAAALGVNVLRYRLIAVLISASMTSVGGVFYAFYYNTLYPEAIFAAHRSIELMLAAIIGGLGTLIGPIFGALMLAGIGELLQMATEGHQIQGLRQLMYGAILMLIVIWRPAGLWPALSDVFRAKRKP